MTRSNNIFDYYGLTFWRLWGCYLVLNRHFCIHAQFWIWKINLKMFWCSVSLTDLLVHRNWSEWQPCRLTCSWQQSFAQMQEGNVVLVRPVYSPNESCWNSPLISILSAFLITIRTFLPLSLTLWAQMTNYCLVCTWNQVNNLSLYMVLIVLQELHLLFILLIIVSFLVIKSDILSHIVTACCVLQ